MSIPEVGYLSGALVSVLASFFFFFWLVIGSDTNGHLLSSSINFVKGVVKRLCCVDFNWGTLINCIPVTLLDIGKYEKVRFRFHLSFPQLMKS